MVAGRSTESRSVTVTIASATVSNKALTGNVATLTTSAAHGFVVGEQVIVSGVDATFNGTYTIASVPSATTFTYSKTAADVVSAAATGTALSTRITAAAGTFAEEDPGRTISGAGIPAGATLASVQSDTTARLSVAATAAGSPSVTLGSATGESHGFLGWAPESDAESELYTVTAVTQPGWAPPGEVTNSTTQVTRRSRS